MNNRNNFDKKPEYWQSMTKRNRGIFNFTSIIPHLIVTAIVIGIYYYITKNGYFPEWSDYIYWGVKIIIGFQVLAAAARSLWGPIIGILSGLGILFSIPMYNISFASPADAWQLIIVSIVGVLVTVIVKM